MPDFLDFLPIAAERIEQIRARLDADANAGLTPDDPSYLDLTVGGFWWDITQALALEIERLWDFASTEVPAASFIAYAWGSYLDGHGETYSLTRKEAALATGDVRFSGEGGTVFYAGTQVATQQMRADEDPLVFVATEGGVIPSPPTGLTATASTTGGTLGANTYHYVVTSTNAEGETVGSAEATATTTGSTSSVSLDWNDMPGATGYRIYRGLSLPGVALLTATTASTLTDTGGTTATGTVPPPTSTASVLLPVEATEVGSDHNVAPRTVTVLLTPISGTSAVTNPGAITGGADLESDESYRARLLLEVTATPGAGTVNDYERWTLAYPGVGYVTVFPRGHGPGTVLVSIRDVDNNPVSTDLQTAVQEYLDPYNLRTALTGSHTLPVATLNVASTTGALESGFVLVNDQRVDYLAKTATSFTGCTGGTGVQASGSPVVQGGGGVGHAPIGAFVAVTTPTSTAVSGSATVAHYPGYELDGAGGAIATRASIEAALASYIGRLGVGEDVVFRHVESQFFRVTGVYDVSALQVNGGTANIVITDTQVAELGTVTLTPG